MPNRIDPDGIGFLIGDLSRMIRADIDRRIEAEIGRASCRERVWIPV